jgi:hypothetical protein
MTNYYSIIALLLTGVSLVFIILTVISAKRRQNISYDIKYGEACYLCKEKIIPEDYNIVGLKLCTKCERDVKLNSFLKEDKKFIPSEKMIQFFLGKKSLRLTLALSSSSIALQMIAVAIKPIGILANLFLAISMYINYKRQCVASRKKVQSK